MPAASTAMASTGDDAVATALIKAYPTSMLGADHPCLASLASILRIYSPSLSAEDLYYKTEAILLQDKSQTITPNVVDQLKATVQREWEGKAKSAAHKAKPMATPTPAPRSGLGSL